MSALLKAPQAPEPQGLRLVQVLSLITALLAAAAAAGGLFLANLYREGDWLVNAIRGQDLYTLAVAVPAMLVTLLFVRRSLRARLVLAGLLGYVLYTYTGAALSFAFNEFFLLYVALFTLSASALVSVVSIIDVPSLPARFAAAVPRRSVAIFLTVIALMLAAGELAQIIPFITTGKLPAVLVLAGIPTFYPYALDLGAIAPLSVLSAVWLWQGKPWGYLLSAVMLIKAATMGFALLAAALYTWLVGGTPDGVELLVGYGIIALGGLGFSVWFLRHCRG